MLSLLLLSLPSFALSLSHPLSLDLSRSLTLFLSLSLTLTLSRSSFPLSLSLSSCLTLSLFPNYLSPSLFPLSLPLTPPFSIYVYICIITILVVKSEFATSSSYYCLCCKIHISSYSATHNFGFVSDKTKLHRILYRHKHPLGYAYKNANDEIYKYNIMQLITVLPKTKIIPTE